MIFITFITNRLTVGKYRAWKIGQQWRNAFQKGEMVARRDRILVTAKQPE